MATASNPTPPAHHFVDTAAAAGVSSPKSLRSSADVTSAPVSPPSDLPAMAGGSSYSASSEDAVAEAQHESSENTDSGNAGKKRAWNKRSSGAAEVGPVMGAATWPALSEISKASPKSSSDSLKNLSEGSTSVSQGTGIASSSSSSHRQVTSSNENPNSTPNHMVPTCQRSMMHGGGNSSDRVSASDIISQAPPPEGLVVEAAPNYAGKSVNSSAGSFSRESTHREGGQRGGFGSQSRSGSEHYQQRNSFRRGNNGPHPRGNGSHHHSYGGRHDQDRGSQDWNPHRNFSGRDAHMQPQRVPSRPFVRGPPHANTPYIPPPNPVRPPFGTPMIYPEVPSPLFYVPGPYPEPFRAVPVVTPMAPLFVPLADPHLPMKIVNQINYYFSDENLVKDIYLRRTMDEQGWVPIKLIAGFKKVSQLTDDIQLILSALQFSNVVEVEGEMVRRRNDWTKWIIPSSVQYSTVPSSHP